MSKYNWDEKHIITFPEEKVALSTKDLHVYYGKKESIKGIDMQFEKNKITALILSLIHIFLMDRDSRKVHAVEPEIVAPYQSEFDKKLIRGPKYESLEEPISKDYHVRFYDLDMNGHVNNSKYLDWIFEVMGADFLIQYIPKKINLKYVKEVRPGGVITSAVERTGLESKHEITSDGATNAQAIITWQEIKKD